MTTACIVTIVLGSMAIGWLLRNIVVGQYEADERHAAFMRGYHAGLNQADLRRAVERAEECRQN
jgi:hypothetical protein